MAYTWEDYLRDYGNGFLSRLVKEGLAGLSVEERLAGLPPEQIEADLQRLRQEKPAPKKRRPKKGRRQAN